MVANYVHVAACSARYIVHLTQLTIVTLLCAMIRLRFFSGSHIFGMEGKRMCIIFSSNPSTFSVDRHSIVMCISRVFRPRQNVLNCVYVVYACVHCAWLLIRWKAFRRIKHIYAYGSLCCATVCAGCSCVPYFYGISFYILLMYLI